MKLRVLTTILLIDINLGLKKLSNYQHYLRRKVSSTKGELVICYKSPRQRKKGMQKRNDKK